MAKNVKTSNEIGKLPAYELIMEQQVGDCKALGLIYKHKKSGARVCVISNDDDNKVFCMAFKTPSRDDTGVAHILEHSVLCGSEKYPAKDPFMELEKGSLNTYLNAVTYSDRTLYPVASCNDKDFENLCSVYIDAVLHPNIYKRKEIFEQEGWHYELESKDSPLTVNGVVFNEMKGAFSSPESRVMRGAIHSVFPDNEYRYESGGLPQYIPTLTRESFLDFHRKYYHPSNSYIYFYGDIDIESRLNWLDEEYLSKYDYVEVDSAIKYQPAIGTKDITNYYPLGSEESDEDAAYLTWTSVAGNSSETEKLIAISIVLDVLFNIPGAPVKEALVSAGIGQEVSAFLFDELQQSLVMLMAMRTEADRMEDFKKIIKTELLKAANEGLNKQSLRAVLNRMEFAQAEAEYGNTPKGLIAITSSLSTWLYDENDPFSTLDKLTVYEKLKKKIDTDYYENIIRECLLKEESSVYITTLPSRTMGDEENAAIDERLAEIKASLSDEQLDEIIKNQENLKKYQSEPSTKEEIESIPILSKEDISIKIRPILTKNESIADVPVMSHDYETNGIVYLKLCYDLAGVPEDKLYLLDFITRLIGEMDTQNNSYLDLNNEINIHTGGVAISIASFEMRKQKGSYRPVLIVAVQTMKEELENSLPLVSEMLFETDFSSKKRLREIIGETSAELKYVSNRSGHLIAINTAKAALNPSVSFMNRVKDLTEYRFVERALKYSDDELDTVIGDVENLVAGIIGRDNMFLDVTCNNDDYEELKPVIEKFVKNMKCTDGSLMVPLDKLGISFDTGSIHKAYKNSGAVNYLAYYGRFECESPYKNGKMDVVSQIISNEYLYNAIRVQGGAYGCGFDFSGLNGIGGFYSYRDPHIAETLEAYKGTAEFLKNFDVDDREMLKNIIGTVGMYISPLSSKRLGLRAMRHSLTGTTEEILEEMARGVVDTTVEDVQGFAREIEQILQSDNYCAVGNEAEVLKNKEMFDSIESML